MKNPASAARPVALLVLVLALATSTACDAPPASKAAQGPWAGAPAADRWYATEFADPSLTAGSDLSLHINTGDDATRQLRAIEVQCTEGKAKVVIRHATTSKEDRKEAEVPLADYLRAWATLRSSGLVDQLMKGDTPAPGTDVYLSGHAGSSGLGFTVSTDSKTAGSDPRIAAAVRAIEALGQD
jgi:hypothetical protein